MLYRALMVLAVATLAVRPAVVRAQIRVDTEFQVHNFTTGPQGGPTVANDSAGGFVVLWDDLGQDGSAGGIFGRFHDASGVPLGGTEFRVNTYTLSDQRTPSVASAADGRLIVVWESAGQDGSGGGIFGRRYDAAGTPLDPVEFQVNTYTTCTQRSSGRRVETRPATSSWCGWGIPRRWPRLRQSQAGATTPRAVPRVASSWSTPYTTCDQPVPASRRRTAVANFVVAWESLTRTAPRAASSRSDTTPRACRVGGEFRVNTNTTLEQRRPVVASDAEGQLRGGVEQRPRSRPDVRRGVAGATTPPECRKGGEFRVNR